MKPAALLPILLIALAMTSACGPRETPRTVSDYCLLTEPVRFAIAPAPGADDPGNIWDTDETVQQLTEANGVWRRLCDQPLR